MEAMVMSYVGTIIKESIHKDISEQNVAQLKAAIEVIPCIEIPEQEKRWLCSWVNGHLE
ncbi:hypothetical protein O9H85_29565 [Paenibacillus filicis]|uniref:Uncharacterized protein n=1 Tax=Paenibacillus gyeongsangnamensis TaxID=3388067 RepID=A0ABT4QHU6_9BACL|nr:hypothetical protein [Paenibacillus filicis]MCZ8516462.1 hypothetical protein [Paenibacillus filicis]